MESLESASGSAECFAAMSDLEVPMINTMLRCLNREHTKLDEQILRLAVAATRLVAHPEDDLASQHTAEIWSEIREYLWSHLQIEDEFVLGWGAAHSAISPALQERLSGERDEMRRLLAVLGAHSSARSSADRESSAKSLLAFSRTLATHIERYDSDVLPSIQRALFHK